MTGNIVIVPTDLRQWDELLAERPAATFFHTSAWIRVLSETYGYEPLCIIHRNTDKDAAVLPLMGVRSFITGNRGVSLPFTDMCEPLLDSAVSMNDIHSILKGFGREKCWDYFELRGGSGDAAQASASYYGHHLDLSPGEHHIASGLRNSTARNIAKADKSGVTVTISDSLRSLLQFVQLNYLTRREHGLPPQPARFFQKIHEHIHSRGKGITVLALYENTPVAGAVFFHYRDQAVYKFGAFDRAYQHLRANNKVMWEAIKWYAGKAYRHFSFGRTEPENEGLLQFKRGWGARESTIGYYRYDLHTSRFVQNAQPHKTGYKWLFARAPVPLLRVAGTIFYKHAG